MKRFIKGLSLFFVVCMVLSGLLYVGLAAYYKERFYFGTWINGIYCTGKTVEEAERELSAAYSYPGMRIVAGGEEYYISAEEAGYTFDFVCVLEEILSRQNPWMWPLQRIHGKLQAEPQVEVDQAAVNRWLENARFYKEREKQKEFELRIQHTSSGYECVDDRSHILIPEAVREAVYQGLSQSSSRIDLEEAGCYGSLRDTVKETATRRMFAKIREFQEQTLIYRIKEDTKKVTPYEFSLFLLTDEEGNVVVDERGELVINEEAVRSFADSLGEEYDTYENHIFTTHDGKIRDFTKGTLGIRIDRKKEAEFLLSWLDDPKTSLRIPEYRKENCFGDRRGIADTYIEVDMGAQRLFYFVEGELVLETEVVTGKGRFTPECVCYVYLKETDRVLRGESYASFVNYWMPVYGNIGIHDANWRSEFGGEIYLSDGSHGCINVPPEIMGKLYELVEVNTPVIMYYDS